MDPDAMNREAFCWAAYRQLWPCSWCNVHKGRRNDFSQPVAYFASRRKVYFYRRRLKYIVLS